MSTPSFAPAGARSGFADLNGGRVAYRDRPGGEPVVLLHTGFVADGMAPLLGEPALAAYRLVAYHRRGYGESARAEGPVTLAEQAADAVALMDELGIERAHLAGHSLGGNVALEVALSAPERVATLSLLEPLLGFAVRPESAQFVADTAADAYARLGAGDAAGALDAWLGNAFDPGYRDVLERTLPGAFEQAVRDASTPFAVEVPALREWPRGLDDLRRIDRPALSVLGGGTWSGFRETHEALLAALPRAEGLHVPEATHLLQLAEPAVVAEGLASFLARNPLLRQNVS